jgi:hypothetical protein
VDGEFDAATESFVFVDDEGDGDAGGSDLPGKPGGGLQLGAPGGAGGNLLREDLGDPGLGEGAELCVQGLPGRRGAGVPESRTCPTGSAPAIAGRGSSVQAEPGLRTAGVGTPSTFASWGTRRKRAVCYWMATLPLPDRHGEPAGAAQVDIGQACDFTRLK